MIGTREHKGVSEKRLLECQEALREYRGLSHGSRRVLGASIGKKTKWEDSRISSAIRVLRKCVEIEQKFRVVTLDDTVKRSVEYARKTVEIPLVFHSRLPVKAITKMTHVVGRDTYEVKARTPQPTIEALEAMREHGQLFDHLEVWWVPNDILIEKIPDPDPIVVGAIKVPRYGYTHFELHRWVDEDVELAWWSREGY